MAMATQTSVVEQIGETAGLVWHTLHEHGPLSTARLLKLVPAPRDLVLQALGWLAREDKLLVEDNGRARLLSLK